jgi:hypothetical protein
MVLWDAKGGVQGNSAHPHQSLELFSSGVSAEQITTIFYLSDHVSFFLSPFVFILFCA